MTGLKRLEDVEAEEQAKLAELTGLENELLKFHEHEQEIRTELMHLMVQKERIRAAGA